MFLEFSISNYRSNFYKWMCSTKRTGGTTDSTKSRDTATENRN